MLAPNRIATSDPIISAEVSLASIVSVVKLVFPQASVPMHLPTLPYKGNTIIKERTVPIPKPTAPPTMSFLAVDFESSALFTAEKINGRG